VTLRAQSHTVERRRAGSARAAYCDVDGTLTDTTIVPPLIWLKRRLLSPMAGMLWLASLAARVPWWLLLDQFSRHASNASIYSCYRRIPADAARQLGGVYYSEHIRPRIFAQALQHLEALRSAGVRIVLVTGNLEFFMLPLALELQADCLASNLEEKDGRFTGRLMNGPLTGIGKSQAVAQHAARHGIDLGRSHALGDAIGDLEMLECVGYPCAINPDRRLAATALKRGWPVERWKQ
jgi:alcohol-forming fatty acyl-CoA reductase